MGLANIVNGHLNELLGNNADIARARMRICKECPIRKDSFWDTYVVVSYG